MSAALGVDLAGWLLLALAAGIVGFSKTAVSGASMISIVLFAAVLPVRESTGALLLVLLTGDLLAIWTYRRDAHWHLLRRLVGPVLVGLALGAVFLAVASASLLRPVIGAIVVVMVAIQVWRSWRARVVARRAADSNDSNDSNDTVDSDGDAGGVPLPEGPAASPHRGGPVFGALAGFTTMVANAGGPVMTLYLLRSRLDVVGFVGTMAWFFFSVNVAKLPISLGLGLVQPSRFLLTLTLVPAVVLGAVAGRALILRVPKVVFEWTVLIVAGLSGLYLLFA